MTPRSRNRDMGDTQNGQEAFTVEMENHAAIIHRLKVAADRAETALKEAKEAAYASLKANKSKNPSAEMKYTSPSRGDRPSVTMAEMIRATNTVDIKGYRKLVDEKVFMATVGVTLTEAKKHVTGLALEKITTRSESAPFLDVKFSKKGS